MEQLKIRKSLKESGVLQKLSMLIVLIVLMAVCAILSENFLSVNNLMNVFRQVAITGIVSLGMMMVIMTGGIDLSVASVISTSTLIAAGLAQQGALVTIVGILLFGLATGAVNGTLVTRFGIQPFIATLGTMSVFKGIGLTYSKAQPIPGVADGISFFGKGKLFDVVPVQGVLFIVLAIIIGIVLSKTKLGRYTYAIGGNEQAARLSGINTKKYITYIYMIGGLMASIGGLVMAAHLNVGEATIAEGQEMDVIASCVIGGTSLQGGKGTVLGTVVGVFIIGVFANLLNLLNVPGYIQPIFKGLIVVIAAGAQAFQDRRAMQK